MVRPKTGKNKYLMETVLDPVPLTGTVLEYKRAYSLCEPPLHITRKLTFPLLELDNIIVIIFIILIDKHSISPSTLPLFEPSALF